MMTFGEIQPLRLFNWRSALDSPVTVVLVCSVVAALLAAGGLIFLLKGRGRLSVSQSRELELRWRSWCWLVAFIVVPILAGPLWTTLAVLVLSLFCYHEFARATGLFREKAVSAAVVFGILLVNVAAADHWERLFFAAGPIIVALIVVATIQSDRPHGYVQRTALGVFGFLLFGFSLGYLSNAANVRDLGNGVDYRPLLLMIFAAVELNDVFAYCTGKLIGGPKWLPNTSPGKTIAGAAGALLLTTTLVVTLGHFIFLGTEMERWDRLVTLGVLISGLGQLGDMTLSSIKRDVGIKDTGSLIPGHGGVLDRFDSLVLVPPAVFHYLSLHLGPLGGDQAVRVFSGSG